HIARLMGPLFDPEVKSASLVEEGKALVGIRDDVGEVMSQLLTDKNDPWLRTLASFSVGEIWSKLYGDQRPVNPDSFSKTVEMSVRKARELKLTDLNPAAESTPEAPKTEYDSPSKRNRP